MTQTTVAAAHNPVELERWPFRWLMWDRQEELYHHWQSNASEARAHLGKTSVPCSAASWQLLLLLLEWRLVPHFAEVEPSVVLVGTAERVGARTVALPETDFPL